MIGGCTSKPVSILESVALRRCFGAKYERAHHAPGTPSTIDHTQIVFGYLTVISPPHYLAYALDNVPEPAGAPHGLATG